VGIYAKNGLHERDIAVWRPLAKAVRGGVGAGKGMLEGDGEGGNSESVIRFPALRRGVLRGRW
jgi:hypothetical protein